MHIPGPTLAQQGRISEYEAYLVKPFNGFL